MTVTAAQIPAGWGRIPDEANGVPLWQWQDQPVYAATRDMDQLLFLGVALARFDEMNAAEFHEFVSAPAARDTRRWSV